MNVLSYLNSLRPCMPTSVERAPAVMTNGEVRRLLKNKAILINGDNDWTAEDEMPTWVWQLVYFPKAKRRTTLIQFNFADLLTLYPISGKVSSSTEQPLGDSNDDPTDHPRCPAGSDSVLSAGTLPRGEEGEDADGCTLGDRQGA